MIAVGKLAVYTAAAGIYPRRVIPVSLDVGTNNEGLLNDPLYLGNRHGRVRGADYDAFIRSPARRSCPAKSTPPSARPWSWSASRCSPRTAPSLSQARKATSSSPVVISNFLHSATILADACGKLRQYCVEGARLHRDQVDDYVGRSLMLVTALSPVIGYDQASAIAHKASDDGTTLRHAALATGYISADDFDRIVNPAKRLFEFDGARHGLSLRLKGL